MKKVNLSELSYGQRFVFGQYGYEYIRVDMNNYAESEGEYICELNTGIIIPLHDLNIPVYIN